MHILDQEAPGLADKIQLIPQEQIRQIIAKGCILASNCIADLEPETQEILRAISANNNLSEQKIKQTRLLADEADENYFVLQEKGLAESQWLPWFYKARLLMAIANGFGGNSWGDFADAVYELSKACDNSSKVISLIESEVETILKSKKI